MSKEKQYSFIMTEENKSKVEKFLKLLNIDADIIEAKNVKEQNEWPQPGDRYYTIQSIGGISDNMWTNCPVDNQLAEIGNCFRTKEDAEFEVERLKVLAEMKKFAEPEDTVWDGYNEHWSIHYNSMVYKDIDYTCRTNDKYNDIYFESEEKAMECVKAIGADRIKKYYLRVEE